MGKTLIIAEKPSVAGDISKALGKFDAFKRALFAQAHKVGRIK